MTESSREKTVFPAVEEVAIDALPDDDGAHELRMAVLVKPKAPFGRL